jgi:DNA modification methylase
MQINYLPLSEIEPAIRNPKNHDLDALHESFSRFGFVMPLLKNMTTGRLTVGHGRLEELQRAKEGGQEPPKNIKVEGEEWLVPVIEGHSFKDDTEAEAYLLADNRLVEVGGWTNEELVPILKDLRDRQALAGTGYTTEEVDKYIRQDILEKQQLLDDSDTVMEPPKNPVSQEGDLWALGDHRLMCGDCTDEQAVRRLLGNVEPFLMVTDPPYGVDYDPEWRAEVGLNAREGPAHGLVENDDREDWQLAWRLFPGAVAYIWHASGKASEVLASLRAQGFELRTQIIWNKSTFAISRSHYHHKHEPCFYVHKPGTSAKWIGGHDQTTVWDIPKNARNDSGHSTQKPVECMRRPMLNHSSDGHPVYDPFLGSGTSITAAESVGQFCYGLEISPAYCDVIIERWKKLTGGSPRRMNGS